MSEVPIRRSTTDIATLPHGLPQLALSSRGASTQLPRQTSTSSADLSLVPSTRQSLPGAPARRNRASPPPRLRGRQASSAVARWAAVFSSPLQRSLQCRQGAQPPRTPLFALTHTPALSSSGGANRPTSSVGFRKF